MTDTIYSKNKPPTPSSVGDDFSAAVSWPILLAGVPTLGAFFAGSSEIWSDFIMILLILFYVYKWMTVPWSYYESARIRRVIHQQSSVELKAGPKTEEAAYLHKLQTEREKQQSIHAELRRHELAGLVWVVLSPLIAGYTLRYSRYFFANADKYISAFNITVFTLAASIKPLSHVTLLLQERTLYLQNEAAFSETEVEMLQSRIRFLEKEIDVLRRAYATKKDLGQITEDINPTLQQLTKTLHRFEKRDNALRTWSQQHFTAIEQKVKEFDQYICYRIEQDQRQQAHGVVVSLVLLPLNISLWIAKRMSFWLPVPHKGLLAPSSESTCQPLKKPQSKQLPGQIAPSSYSNDESVAAFGH
ncbi:hypothetical protein BCV72DRAFT_233212 [Rhizopus microsporus var. microsporus]|uniref:Uncharacterized protein n=2 Tax=Rhizopus microsporus TaxID=58291 RepID=A0A2G4T163_RHIZD|nr:uncharacterized protein RHIMIDRAFT_276161 [Rhizopus microsporus ATCC 52813]ORE03326.1 hypothetical protein BCV72DRAFT_233212 [Rhizopus microsporus var. microsporus]PHZ14765.1 hypothetical protein RHIMIDRAFT_276161 [Rhizopus microsporus ATCC 52813]